MQTSFFDINTMLKDIAVFDQAITASTANMKVNFDVQIAGISQSFNATFAAIDVATLNSSLLLSANFTAALALLNAELIATQMISDSCFGLMPINALTFFTVATGGIITTMAVLNAAVAISCLGMELSFATSFLNITLAFSTCLVTMNILLATSFAIMLAVTSINASAITNTMLKSFNLITAGMLLMSIQTNSMLDGIAEKFEQTAQKAKESFSDAQISISENMNIIGFVSTENTEKTNNGFAEVFDGFSKGIGIVSGGLNIFKSLRDIFGATKDTTSSLTQVLNINKGVQMSNTATTATAGATASSAALSTLAFGGGVLALGAGVLLAGMALALLAKTVFNFLKMSGLSTNGVKASDFDLSFSVPGLASGGFPSMGQMFIAREAGPELVGTIGSRTAVANNYQIEEGIARAVTRAMNQASLGGNWIIQLVDEGGIKSETIISAAERRNRRDGRTICFAIALSLLVQKQIESYSKN